MGARLRRAWIPPGASGRLAACAACEAGDGAPLRAWEAKARPLLEQPFDAAGFAGALRDDAVAKVLEQAWLATKAGRAIDDEQAWIAEVAWRIALDRHAEHRRTSSLGDVADRVPDAHDPIAELAALESWRVARDGFIAEINGLPEAVRDAMAYRHLWGCSVRGTARLIEERHHVGYEATRKSLRRAEAAVRESWVPPPKREERREREGRGRKRPGGTA